VTPQPTLAITTMLPLRGNSQHYRHQGRTSVAARPSPAMHISLATGSAQA